MGGKILSLVFLASVLILLQRSAISQDVVKPVRSDEKPVEPSTDDCSCDDVVCEIITEDKCPHGLVDDTSDPCRCCRRCGNGEYEYCDPVDLPAKELSEKQYNFGLCGRGLTCRANDGLPPGAPPEMVCYCAEESMVCGSDGITHETECTMEKIAFETGRNIRKERKGMCQGAPRVVTPPIDVANSTVGNVYLQCEVMGNPVPRVEWRKIGPDGPGDFLPSGDSAESDRVTVHTRGGPEEYEVTAWLQIMRLKVEDGGEYECVGINKFGEDSGKASILVVKKPKLAEAIA